MEQTITVASVAVDHTRKTIRPLHPEGDAFYGLELGTNGTAATHRRALVEFQGYVWLRHDWGHAAGLFLVPSNKSNGVPSPWTGMVA